ncbi:MAG: anti-sigma factor, partial [Stackebrandtia sp.]
MNSEKYGGATTVRVRVPAEDRQLTLLGALTETALLLADFPVDEVADIQIAIDEITADLTATAVRGSVLE